MITLGQAIKFDHTKKAKSLTGGVFIPIVSNYRAKKAFNAIKDIFQTKAEEEKKIEKDIINTDLVMRQIICSGLFTILSEGEGETRKEGIKLYEELFFIKFDEKKYIDFLADQIKKLDERIEVDKVNEDPMSFADIVEWVEVVRDKGSIDRKIDLFDFKSKYETAVVIAKKQNNGQSN